jgi:anti-anti-sigma regulatory factor
MDKGRIVPNTKRLFSSWRKFMPFIRHNGSSVTVVSASGFLGKGDTERIKEIVNGDMKRGVKHFIVDFSDVSHIHYADVSMLIDLKEVVAQDSGEVKFVVKRPYVIDIFLFAGWRCVDDVYPTEDSALNAFKEYSFAWRERVDNTYTRSFEGNH